MSSNCFNLYPPGTLGRILVDLALMYIKYIDPGSFHLENSSICIDDPGLFKDSIVDLINMFKSELQGRPSVFPTTGNDRGVIKKALLNRFDPSDPSTIIDFIIDILRTGNPSRLGKTLTTPSILRLEYYEYSRPGYSTRIKQEHKNYPHKEINLISLALAVLGAYISYISTNVIGNERINTYIIPSRLIPLNELIEAKKTFSRIIDAPHYVKAYVFSRTMLKLGLLPGEILGDIIKINLGKNRYSLVGIEKISDEGLISILQLLSNKHSLWILDTISRIVVENYGKRRGTRIIENYVKILGQLLHYLYNYAICITDAKYQLLRLITTIINGIEEGGADYWKSLRNKLINLGVKDPVNALSILSKDLADTSNVCGE